MYTPTNMGRTLVAFHCGLWEVRDVGERDSHAVGERLGNAGKSAAANDGCGWREVGWKSGPDVLGRLPHNLDAQLVVGSYLLPLWQCVVPVGDKLLLLFPGHVF